MSECLGVDACLQLWITVLGYSSICVSEYVGGWVSGRLGDWVSVCMWVCVSMDIEVWVSACLGCR